MAGIEIEPGISSKQGQEAPGVLAFLFFMSGVYGLLLFFGSVESVVYSGWLVYPATALYCGLLWYFWTKGRRLFWAGVLASVLCGAAAVFLLRDTLRGQLLHIVSGLCKKAGSGTVRVTEAALLFALFLSLMLFLSEFMAESHMIWYLLTVALLFLSPMMNVRISAGTLFLMILFQAGFFCARGSGRAVAAAAAVLFVAVGIFVSFYSENLYAAAYDIDGFFQRSLLRASGRAKEAASEGTVSRGNNYRTGTVLLELASSSKPTETLYLQGFEGGEYIGGEWIPSDDEVLFENMAEKLNWQQWGHMISNLYFHMYFVMNQSTLTGEPAEPISLTICHTNGNYENLYVPYYRRYERGWGQNRYLNPSNGQADGARPGYSYLYYEQKDMHIDWDHVGKDFEEPRNWYREIEASYMEEAKEAYTQVPRELLPGLVKLVEENPLTDRDEITSFILYTLHTSASYTLTPGWAPFNEDIVEYFLFEGKSGYCVHFASAASLMYRLYGIPARYVSGYMVQPDAFAMEEDGFFHADVTDEQAHAWVEIFLPDYGWTPVEVTPAGDGTAVASYPGFDSSKLNLSLTRQRRTEEEQDPAEKKESTYTGGEKGTGGFFPEITADFKAYRDLFLVLGTCLVVLLFLFPLFLDYRRLRKRRRMENMDCRTIFACLLKLLHDHGEFLDMDGTEPDFARNLAEFTPELTEQEAGLFIRTVSDSAYGPEREETHLDVERALWVYRSVERALGGKL